MAGLPHSLIPTSPKRSRWLGRIQTFWAMTLILRAEFLVRLVPMERWHRSLGTLISHQQLRDMPMQEFDLARSRAARISRAATRLPYDPKCLVQAMALQWLLLHDRVSSRLVIAMKIGEDETPDTFHAWVEWNDEMLIGSCDRSQYRKLLTFEH